MQERSKSEVARLVCDGRWKLKHLQSFRTQFGDRALFDALYDPFDSESGAEYTINDQQIAGELLLELQPECSISATEAIARSLNRWNRSIEELPFYLIRCFGREEVLEAIREVERNPSLDDSARTELRTYRYWLQAARAE